MNYEELQDEIAKLKDVIKRLRSDVDNLRTFQPQINNNLTTISKDITALKNNVINKSKDNPTSVFLRGDRTYQPFTSMIAKPIIPILNSIPEAIAGYVQPYILQAESAVGSEFGVRLLWPDSTDHGLYIPFSRI